jgi:hypothetical protein
VDLKKPILSLDGDESATIEIKRRQTEMADGAWKVAAQANARAKQAFKAGG